MDPEVLARFKAIEERLALLERAVLPQPLDEPGENKAVEGDDA